jgi:hypothetical protein
MKHAHQSRRTALHIGLAAGGAVVVAGVVVALAAVLGRPGVTVSTADSALVSVSSHGLGASVSQVTVTSGGKPVPVERGDGGFMPTSRLAQGEEVRVTATVQPASWLSWLVGSGVTKSETFRTPSASLVSSVAIAKQPGRIAVSFDHAVSVVRYQLGSAASHTMRLSHPTSLVDLPVPAADVSGSLEVSAAPRPWERLASRTASLTWFVAPKGGVPALLASPAPGSTNALPDQPITLTFDEPVADALGGTRPTLSPSVPGTWTEPNADSLEFRPSGFGYGPDGSETVSFDRPLDVLASGTTTATADSTSDYHFSAGPGSLLRLEQLLAELHYLPLRFTPAAGVSEPTTLAGEIATISHPLAGTFSWRWADTPSALENQWTPGTPSVMLKGALMAFDAYNPSSGSGYNGYQLDDSTVAQIANSSTWEAVIDAALAHQVDPEPYSFVSVSQVLPESISLWQNGSVVLTSVANTGIPQDPTYPGTYPIYLRYVVNTMSGTNPNGSHYDDIVHWINYFNGSEAVHQFPRAAYGFPQSLGCVELPATTASTAFHDLAIGDLVDVANN